MASIEQVFAQTAEAIRNKTGKSELLLPTEFAAEINSISGSSVDSYTKEEVNNLLDEKQDNLVNGVNIKSLNGQSLLGSGNITLNTTIPQASDLVLGGIKAVSRTSQNKEVFIDPISSKLYVEDTNLTDYYNKSTIDSKLSEKLNSSIAEATYAKKTDISSIFVFKGSCTYSELIKLLDSKIGDVWNVTDKAGMNYVCIASGGGADAWDALGTTASVDLSDYYTKLQSDERFAPISHTHNISDINNLETKLGNKSDIGHTHTIENISNLQNLLDEKQDAGDYVLNSSFVSGLNTKADKTHTHEVSQVNGLAVQLAAKANANDVYSKSEIDDMIGSIINGSF